MRKIISIIVLFLIHGLGHGQEIQWMSFAEALEAQKKAPKKIIMDVYTDWCGPCKLMDKNTFGNPQIAAYVNSHYYAVKFDAEGNEEITFYDAQYTNPNFNPERKGRRNATHQFTQFLGIQGYPSVVFFSEDGDPIMPIMGYHNVQQFELYLKMIKQGDYQTFSSPDDFEKYRKAFVPRFKG
jgi:thioredoxin-related protein